MVKILEYQRSRSVYCLRTILSCHKRMISPRSLQVAVLKREVASARATLKKLSTPPAKPIKELEHEILTLKQMVATLQVSFTAQHVVLPNSRQVRSL